MLQQNRNAEHAIDSFSRGMIARNQFLLPRENTPLAELVSASMTTSAVVAADAPTTTILHLNRIESATIGISPVVIDETVVLGGDDSSAPKDNQTTVTYMSTHSKRYVALADLLAGVVARNMPVVSLANQMIKNTFDDAARAITGNNDNPPINIIPCINTGIFSVSSPLKDFAEASNQAKGISPDKVPNLPVFPCLANIDLLDIKSLIDPSAPRLTELLAQWASEGGAGVIYSVYQNFFQDDLENREDGISYRTILLDVMRENPSMSPMQQDVLAMDCLLGLLLLSLGLEKLNMSLDSKLRLNEVQSRLGMIRNYAGRQLARILTNIQTQSGSGRLVYSYPAMITEKCDWNAKCSNILVDQDAYDSFLEKGGKPEILIGAYLSDRMPFTEQLLQNSTEYMKKYDGAISNMKRQRAQNEINIIAGIVRDRLGVDANSEHSPLKGAQGTGIIQKEYQRFVRSLNQASVKNLYVLIRNLYADSIFAATEAGGILRAIDMVEPTDDADATLHAGLVTFVTDYLISCCEFKTY